MQVYNRIIMAPRAAFSQGLPGAGLRPAARSVHAQAERSYVMVKPDGVQRGLVGQIITRFEQKGFQIKGLKMFQTPEELAKEHYKDLSDKPFYGKLVDYILSGPVVCIVRFFMNAFVCV
jgi:nucleoside-diphosphate kinase